MDVSNAISVVSASDAGLVRPHNEDVVASDLANGLVILADGMGGHRCGEMASAMAVSTITTELTALFANQSISNEKTQPISAMLNAAVMQANQAIKYAALEHEACEGMGTTLVCGVFFNNKIVIGHIGDSRMYRLRGDEFVQLTEDHSVVQEQVNAGLISKEEARHASNGHLVTRALGTNLDVELELSEYEVKVGDIYLLCSDGLTDLVEDAEIKETIIHADEDMSLVAQELLALATVYGGKDNISVILASVRKSFPNRTNNNN